MAPKISVLLPVYNAASFIGESIQSILDQTESDFELFIIDDCSTDNSLQIIESFQDSRIILRKKEKNTGYTESLNWGIDQARGKYIARMDADDVSLPKRFEKQVLFLEQNQHIAICGTDARVEGSNLKFNYPTEPKAIEAHLLLGSSLIHPSIMGKVEIFKQFKYDKLKEPAEDYDLFTRIVAAGGYLANLEESLLIYRVHTNQISKVQNQKQISSAQQSMLRMFKLLKYNEQCFTDYEVRTFIWPFEKLSKKNILKGISFYNALNKPQFKEKKDIIEIKKFNFIKFYFHNPELLEGLNKNNLLLRSLYEIRFKYFIKLVRSLT